MQSSILSSEDNAPARESSSLCFGATAYSEALSHPSVKVKDSDSKESRIIDGSFSFSKRVCNPNETLGTPDLGYN
jgi:hypothetical protein